MSAMTSSVSQDEAEALWTEVRQSLVNLERCVARIIETRAWEPLGFDSFAQAWRVRMSGVRLSGAPLQAAVVYQLLDEGADKDAILSTLGVGSGVGPAVVDALTRQRSAGVPPRLASTVVRQHERSLPGAPRFMHLEISPEEMAEFQAIAERRNLDPREEAVKAIRAHFRRLEAKR